jgi:HK97 gp10 family phage protein
MADPPAVTGLDETLRALAQIPEVATQQNALRRALVKAAQPIADAARAMAPDDPRTPAPDLKSSIAVATQLTKRHRAEKESEVEVYVGPTVQAGRSVLNYASNVEFGTFRAAPRPYLRPAFHAESGKVMEILRKELAAEIEKAVARIARKQAKARD